MKESQAHLLVTSTSPTLRSTGERSLPQSTPGIPNLQVSLSHCTLSKCRPNQFWTRINPVLLASFWSWIRSSAWWHIYTPNFFHSNDRRPFMSIQKLGCSLRACRYWFMCVNMYARTYMRVDNCLVRICFNCMLDQLKSLGNYYSLPSFAKSAVFVTYLSGGPCASDREP